MSEAVHSIEAWSRMFTEREIPVLRQTVRALEQAATRSDRINAREVVDIVMRDPLMSLRVLRFCMRNRGRRQLQDISTIEHALMMLGVEPFFHHFAGMEAIEDTLRLQPRALLGLLQVIRRSQRAARYALDWAAWRCDLSSEEVAVAALLHDLAEMMLWCFAPSHALQIQARLQAAPGTRSADAQTQVLGFPLNRLQHRLCIDWQLPELLTSLMDDAQSDRPRVRNVKLAADLARHSAHGWDDPALPDDLKAIAALMNIDDRTLRLRLGIE